MKLGPFIKARRGQLGLSLDAVAAAAGVSKTTVHDLEREANANPEAKTLMGLARALRTKPEIVLAATIESLRSV